MDASSVAECGWRTVLLDCALCQCCAPSILSVVIVCLVRSVVGWSIYSVNGSSFFFLRGSCVCWDTISNLCFCFSLWIYLCLSSSIVVIVVQDICDIIRYMKELVFDTKCARHVVVRSGWLTPMVRSGKQNSYWKIHLVSLLIAEIHDNFNCCPRVFSQPSKPTTRFPPLNYCDYSPCH